MNKSWVTVGIIIIIEGKLYRKYELIAKEAQMSRWYYTVNNILIVVGFNNMVTSCGVSE